LGLRAAVDPYRVALEEGEGLRQGGGVGGDAAGGDGLDRGDGGILPLLDVVAGFEADDVARALGAVGAELGDQGVGDGFAGGGGNRRAGAEVVAVEPGAGGAVDVGVGGVGATEGSLVCRSRGYRDAGSGGCRNRESKDLSPKLLSTLPI
jgi:hypothetical protein